MSIATVRSQLKDYAKDIKINLGNVLTEEGAPGLANDQIYGIALACVFATRDKNFIKIMVAEAESVLSAEQIEAAKAAATIMAMNNMYYRFLHLTSQQEFTKLPANLRMNIIGSPGIEKRDFELYCLAVSVLNGCGMCIDAHIATVLKAGASKEAIHSSVRIAAVINATSQALLID